MKNIYMECGENELNSILDMDDIAANHEDELADIIKTQREELIELQHDNGDDYDPDTGEEYGFIITKE